MKKNKIQKKVLAIFLIILLEFSVFNFRYYMNKIFGLNSEVIELNKEHLTTSKYDGFKFEKEYKVKIGKEVKGIKLKILQDSSYKEIKITPKFTDESSRYKEKELDEIRYLPTYKNREYIVINSQERCLDLTLEMESNGNFNLESIEINTWYFEFNWVRVLILILISSIILYRKEINKYFEKHSSDKKTVYIGFIVILTLILGYYSFGFGKSYENSAWENGMVLKDMYRELTKSIMQGKLSLDFPEDYREELLGLQNYQDYSEREELKTHYLYDGAFYKGNFYCYYGVIPAFTVLVPIVLFTGIYCYSNVICIVYGTLVSIMILKIYLKLLEKFKIKFGFILEFVGYITSLLTMELFLLCLNPNFYQAVDLCGIFWSLFAFWQVWSLENNKKIKRKLFLIGLSYGCMVLTRPVYVFYIIPIIIAIWKYLIQNKKIAWKNLVVFALPIIIMAFFQMWYNYARFENIFEFGQFHQITINDTSSLELEPGIAIDGTLSFLFNPPVFARHFPFVNYNLAGVRNGNEIFTAEVLGIFWHPLLLILLTAKNRIKNNPKLKKLALYTSIFCVITIILLVISICTAGVIQRYLTFILPTLTILAIVYWLLYITESKNEEVKKDRIKIFKMVCCGSVIIMSLYGFININGSLLNDGNYKHIDKRVIDYTIRHSLEFYK